MTECQKGNKLLPNALSEVILYCFMSDFCSRHYITYINEIYSGQRRCIPFYDHFMVGRITCLNNGKSFSDTATIEYKKQSLIIVNADNSA